MACLRAVTLSVLTVLAFAMLACAVEDTKPTTASTTTTLGLVVFEVRENENDIIAEAGDAMRGLGINPPAFELNDTVIVVGENLDSSLKGALAYAYARFPDLISRSIPASRLSFDDAVNSTRLFITAGLPVEKTLSESSTKTGGTEKARVQVQPAERLVVLVGGPSQNHLTAEFLEKGLIGEEQEEFSNQMLALAGNTSDRATVIVFSDRRGFGNLARKAAEYSPLSRFLPLEWVPLVASLLGAVFVMAVSLIKACMEAVILARGKKSYGVSKNALKVFRIKVCELLAVFAAALVLGLTLSWTYAGPTISFFPLLILNLFLCLTAGLSHEATHWLMGRLLKVETEYRFWLSGSIATIASALLGNSFGLQGFLLDEIGEDVPKWKVGLMKLAPPMLSTAVMTLTGVLNYLKPHVAFQMAYSIAGITAMADILPFKPMDGYNVRRWSIPIWLIAFTVISVLFLAVNFVL